MTGKSAERQPTEPDKLEARRRLLLRLGVAAALMPVLAACHDDDDKAPPPPSDVRLKEDVIRIGTTAHGLPYYSFRYIGRPEVYAGVMAQDVLEVMPEAIIVGDDGFYRVDYGRLGTQMVRLQ